ncbi:MAG: phage adsorption protein NrfB [Alphaproteobacteria bacterium]|nr:phage adsorption protein NrfB [Alphaproteobacteria bacterium]
MIPLDITWLTAHSQDLLQYWHYVQIAFAVAAVIILVSSTDDMLLDLLYWIVLLSRWVVGDRRPATLAMRRKPEKLAAILIPAWHESGVIGHMLDVAASFQEYRNYYIFVGTYPNDPATIAEVEAAALDHRNVCCVVTDRPGPTTKADCLNQLVRAALEKEKTLGERFEFFVNHDAEDVVHAFELKLMNWYIETCGMIQIPVLSLPRNPRDFVACHYMDEFAEWHSKDLVVRSTISGMTPSAGVGTALGRDALDALMEARKGEIFNRASLTEDYDLAQAVTRLGFRSRFIRYRADMPYLGSPWFSKRTVIQMKRELVATQEYFPNTIRTAVRQKARWMLGISFMGWHQVGWHGTLAEKYFLWRDRKILFAAPAAIFAYVLVIQIVLAIIAMNYVAGFPTLPPVIAAPWVWTVVMINLGLMLNRLLHRGLFVWYAHGRRYVALSPLRVITSNWISFRAFLRALRQYVFSLISGRALKWDKTSHSFPTFTVVRRKTSAAKVAIVLLALVAGMRSMNSTAQAADTLPPAATSQSDAEKLSDLNAKIAASDAAYLRLERAILLQRMHRDAEALTDLEAGRGLAPDNANILFALAYAYRNAGRNREAADTFEAALKADPSKFALLEDEAYALKDSGQLARASDAFRAVRANKPRYPQATDAEKLELAKRMHRVEREIEELDRAFYATGFLSYRSSGGSNLFSVANGTLFTSQAGAEIGWRPILGDFPERKLDLYARTYFSFKPDSLTYDSHSLQFGLGARFKPISTIDLRLSAERLIKSGSNTRDGWLGRAGYFWGRGVDLDPFADNWNYTTFYGDLAYIPGSHHFFSAFAEVHQGWRFRLGEATTLTPHAVFSTQYSEDGPVDHSTAELGGGLTLSRWYDVDDYAHAANSRADLSLEYRAALSSSDSSNWLLKLIVAR